MAKLTGIRRKTNRNRKPKRRVGSYRVSHRRTKYNRNHKRTIKNMVVGGEEEDLRTYITNTVQFITRQRIVDDNNELLSTKWSKIVNDCGFKNVTIQKMTVHGQLSHADNTKIRTSSTENKECIIQNFKQFISDNIVHIYKALNIDNFKEEFEKINDDLSKIGMDSIEEIFALKTQPAQEPATQSQSGFSRFKTFLGSKT